MKRKSIVIAAALAATVGAAALVFDTPSFAQPYGGGWGMMGGYGPGRGPGPGYGRGPGWMHGGGYGPGWMMGGYGPGWMHGGYGPGWMHGQDYGPGWCWGNRNEASAPQGDLKLTTDQVKARMEQWLAFRHNPRLKLGDVKEKDADTITADVVTVDNSLVQRFDINRHTGFTQPEEGN